MCADRSAPDKVHMPKIEETEAILPRGIVAMIGGPWAIFGFAALTFLIIAVDLGFPMLMGIDLQAPCLALAPHSGGGFASALLVLLVFAVTGLSWLTPRSIWFSILFLVATVTVVQYQIGANTDVKTFLNATIWLSSLANLPVQPFCGQGLPDMLQAQYTLVGYQSDELFATGLGLNLLLLAMAAIVVWALVIIRMVFAFVARLFRRGVPANGNRAVKYVSGNLTERGLIVVSAALTVMATMAFPSLSVLSSKNPQGVFEGVRNIMWIGPLLFLVDYARLAWAQAMAEEHRVERVADTAIANPLLLEKLVRSLRASFPKRAVFDMRIEGRPTSHSSDGSLDDFALPQAGGVELYESSLLAGHLDRFVRVINRSVLDKGLCALVIGPNEAIGDISTELEARFGANPGGGLVRTWSEGQNMENSHQVELVYATPESLARLLDNNANFQGFLDRLGGIFFLSFHRLDLGLVHVGLTRLKQYIHDPEQLVALVQFEWRQGMSDWISNLPLLKNMKSPTRHIQDPGSEIDQYLILGLPGPSDRTTGDETAWPSSAQFMAHALRNSPGAGPYHFDQYARHIPTQWANMVQRLRHAEDPTLAQRMARLKQPVVLPLPHPHPMAVIEDVGNVIDALRTNITTEGACEALRIILRGTYPAARFLEERLRDTLSAVPGNVEKVQNALEDLGKQLGSLTPQPDGGPVELAMILRQEILSRKPGQEPVNQRDIQILWPEKPVLLRQLQVSNTRAGIERLLRIALQIVGPEVFLSSSLQDDRNLTYSLTADILARGMAFETLRVEVSDNVTLGAAAPAGRRIEVLPMADHGLSYMEKTRFVVGGRLCAVDWVDIERRIVQVVYREEEQFCTHTFVRDYGFLTASENGHGFAAQFYHQLRDRSVPQELASGYMQVARRTRGFYTHSQGGWLSDGNGAPVNMTSGSAVSPQHLRSVAVLRCHANSAIEAVPKYSRKNLPGASWAAQTGSSVSARVAFTLATTLQDILHTCFPLHAHRLAVLCPEAEAVMAEVGTDSGLRFARDRMPRIQLLDPTTQQVVQSASPGEAGSGMVDLASAFLLLASQSVQAEPPKPVPRLTFFLVEDSDHDLGVVRSIVSQHYDDILRRWSAFVEHCAGDAGKGASFAYAFGAAKVPSCYDFEGAREFLKEMLSRGQ